MSQSKICVIHDTFIYKWWAERLVLLMVKTLKSDLITAFFDKWSYDLKEWNLEWQILEVSHKINNKFLKILKYKFDFLFNTNVLKKYQIVFFSWDCIDAVRNCWRNSKKYYYCHTPPRYIFDQKKEYLAKVPLFLKPFFLFLVWIFKYMYLYNLSKMDKIFTNSSNTQKRLKTFTGFDSDIIYPPVDIKFFEPSNIRKDYYFSSARLSSIKRVDKITEAFSKMPDKKLIFIYWENDPEKDKILEFIKNYPNIEAIKSPTDKELKKLISESIATIYIPVDEDFGMSPIESMACWVPVIGVNDWWLKETIIQDKTWLLIDSEARIKDIENAVNILNLKKSLEMKEDCILRAQEFSLWKFEEKIKINL